MPKKLPEVIRQVVAEFFAVEGAMGAAFGGCGDFADYCYTNAIAAGLSVDFEGVYGTLSESSCAFTAPIGTNLDQLAAWGVIEQLSHVWLIHDGRHYDAMTPEGVDDPFKLRLFRQVCVEVMRKSAPQELEQLVKKHEWWGESVLLTDEFLAWDQLRISMLKATA